MNNKKTKFFSKTTITLLVIILITIFLRFWSITYGLPDIMYIDAQKTVGISKKIAYNILTGNFNIDPEKYIYPTFYINIMAIEYTLYGVGYGLINTLNGKYKSFKEAINELYTPPKKGYFYYGVPPIFYLMARVTSAIAGTLTVLFTFLFVLTAFKDRRKALISALFIGLMFFHIKDSKYPMTDATMCLMGIIAAYYIAKISIDSKLKNYILAGIFIGLGFSTKYFPIILTIPLGLIMIKDWFDLKGKNKMELYKKAIIVVLMIAIFFVVGTPIFLVRTNKYLKIGSQQVKVQRQRRIAYTQSWYFDYLFNTAPINHELFSTNGLWCAMGYPMLILLLLGIIFSFYKVAIKKSENPWIELGFTLMIVLFYIAMAGEGKKRLIRYFYVAYPIYAVIAANFLIDIIDLVCKRIRIKKKDVILWCAAIIVVAPTAIRTVRFNYIRSFPDNRIPAGKWIEENIPPGSKIFMPILYPPLISVTKYDIQFYRGDSMKNFHPSVNLIRRARFNYVITSSYDSMVFYMPDSLREHIELSIRWCNFFAELDEKATLLKRFETNNVNIPGPEIKIYKL